MRITEQTNAQKSEKRRHPEKENFATIFQFVSSHATKSHRMRQIGQYIQNWENT